MGGDTIKYLTCNSDAFRVTMVDKTMNYKYSIQMTRQGLTRAVGQWAAAGGGWGTREHSAGLGRNSPGVETVRARSVARSEGTVLQL